MEQAISPKYVAYLILSMALGALIALILGALMVGVSGNPLVLMAFPLTGMALGGIACYLICQKCEWR